MSAVEAWLSAAQVELEAGDVYEARRLLTARPDGDDFADDWDEDGTWNLPRRPPVSRDDERLADLIGGEALSLLDAGLAEVAASRLRTFTEPKFSSLAECEKDYRAAMECRP